MGSRGKSLSATYNRYLSSKKTIGFPKKEAHLKHMFARRSGHVPDTPYYRKLVKNLANNPSIPSYTDKYGKIWKFVTRPSGDQVWVTVRNGVIRNCGINKKPWKWVPGEGLRSDNDK